jgi:hypothetical protein
MAIGTARNNKSTGENVIHIGALRFRVIGEGNLNLTLNSLQDVKSKTLVPLAMTTTTDKEPAKVTNFMSQRISLTMGTDNIDEWFRVNRIIFFAKEVFTGYPNS